MPDDNSSSLISYPGDDAFKDGALNKAWLSRLVKLVLRQILIKGTPGANQCKVWQSPENIIIDLTNLFNTNDTLWLAVDGVATPFGTILIPKGTPP